MSGLGIAGAPMPAPRYRLTSKANRNVNGLKFESKRDAAAEDETRAIMLLLADMSCPNQRAAATELARRLALGDWKEDWPETLASSRYMRRQRTRIIGNTWALVDRDPSPVSTFTLLPRGWDFSPEDLATTDPNKLLAAVRSDLIRTGALAASGWLICFVHGEFDSGRRQFQLHIHGLAAGGMIDVVDGLRHRPKYRSCRGAAANDGVVFQRVKLSRGILTHLPNPISYILKSFWPCRWTGTTGSGGISRRRGIQRIPEPYHAQYLLWLDQWELKDISLLLKLRVTKAGLVKTMARKLYTNGDKNDQ